MLSQADQLRAKAADCRALAYDEIQSELLLLAEQYERLAAQNERIDQKEKARRMATRH